jgi:hypothetical protein
MTALVGGIGALVLGIILLVVWWGYFLALIAGAIPLILLLGGALATYLGVEEYKDKLERGKVEQEPFPASTPVENDTEKYKKESEQYKQEVDALKQEIESLKNTEKEE